jgi:hypothetical protein
MAQNLVVSFDDDATQSTMDITGTTALTSTVIDTRPDGQLSTFAGEPINGTWNVLACDRNTNQVQGTITYARLSFTVNTNAVNQSIPWKYTVTNTANSDGVARDLLVWAVDQAGNAGPMQRVTFNIDTTAPTTSVTQNAEKLLPGTTYDLFQGTVSDPGVPQPIEANIYSQAGLIDSYSVPVDAVSHQWTLEYVPRNLAAGTYAVQFVVRDAVGNQWTSDAYNFVIDTITKPVIDRVELPVTGMNTVMKLDYAIDTGGDITDISTKVILDSDATAPVTNTTVFAFNRDGTKNSAGQALIPASLQNQILQQLEIDNTLAAVLSNDGSVYTWPLTTTNTMTITNVITNVAQISMGTQITTTQRLLTLGIDGVVNEYTPISATLTLTETQVVTATQDGETTVVESNVVTSTFVISQTQITTVPLPGLATAIDAGRDHNLAIMQSGQVYAWGSNDQQEISTTITDTHIITPTAIGIMGAVQIGAGDDFSVVLRQDGSVVAWGKNDLNQSTVPISATSRITQISVGNNHTLALRDDGSVVAWGANDMGQTTVPISATNALYVVAAANASAAIRRDGTVVVWGTHTANTACCAVALSFNDTQMITMPASPFALRYNRLIAAIDAQFGQVMVDRLIPGRRYRYIITATNGAGSTIYTGTFNTIRTYHRVFAPFLTKDASTTVPTGTGR